MKAMQRYGIILVLILAFAFLAGAPLAVYYSTAAGPTVTPPPATRALTGTTTAPVLNVRAGPGKVYPVLAKLLAGETVTATGRTADNGWVYLTTPRIGWVSAEFVEFADASANALALLPAVRDATPTVTPTPLATPTAQLTVLPGGFYVHFDAEPDALHYAGQCADLFWNVEGVKEVYLSGVAVNGHDSKRVCPKSSTSYQLHTVKLDGTFIDVWTRITTNFTYCNCASEIVIVTATPGPTQTPWVVIVTATPTRTPTLTPTATRTPTPSPTP
ncbi:MAG: SH3 domain-containing protein [Chloroflexi bacterium]|nr:SH3 domain-containing protein [Chloroflexota bacterium]